MRLQRRGHGDIDLSQPGMQAEIRSHIARCLRDYPNGGEGVLLLLGSIIVSCTSSERRSRHRHRTARLYRAGLQRGTASMQEARSPLPRKDHD